MTSPRFLAIALLGSLTLACSAPSGSPGNADASSDDVAAVEIDAGTPAESGAIAIDAVPEAATWECRLGPSWTRPPATKCSPKATVCPGNATTDAEADRGRDREERVTSPCRGSP
jgi:hypothetical protein